MSWRAFVDRTWNERGVRLYVIHDGPPGEVEVVMSDGTWQRIPEGATLAGAGLELEAESLPAIARALAEHLGNALPSQAEVAVLREVLAKEQQRVDNVLERGRW